MTDVIKKSTNKWTKGLVMDFSPEHTSNECLTNALNATFLTFNGNEFSLQNDMGNGRVETAYLPEGYIPVGTCEYGGIIYIVSYNPLEDKSLIGCFPSPERNISNDELGISDKHIGASMFLELEAGSTNPTGKILHTSQLVILKNDKLNPGDKFIILSDENIYNEALSELYKDSNLVDSPMIALNIVSIEDSGRIVYLNNDIRQYDKKLTTKDSNDNEITNTYNYHILGTNANGSSWALDKPDLDSYRNVLSSGYNVFKSKTSGKLAILAELITIDSYSVTHKVEPDLNDTNKYKVILYTEVTPEVTAANYKTVPKLQYYYLENSQGFLQVGSDSKDQNKPNIMYLFDLDTLALNTNLLDVTLNQIYDVIIKSDKEEKKLEDIRVGSYTKDGDVVKDPSFNFNKPKTYYGKLTESNDSSNYYKPIELATIVIPQVLTDNKIDLPFIYDYTIVPCMEYGRLEHLAVSNTVDFSKLHRFDLSGFNTWKYRIDGNLLRLVFGAEIYDTFETDKVDGLVLEFYDLWGFAGSLEITNKKSYNGVFTKILQLNLIGTLSNKKIVGNQYSQNYRRNIGITMNESKNHYFNNKQIHHDSNGGWYFNASENNGITTYTWLDELDNDCGTLYSNILYLVKPYIRLTNANGDFIFTSKDIKFLYTLPILNDYFYKVDNFDNIKNPDLDFVMTFKLTDNSTVTPYNGEIVDFESTNTTITIKDGYNPNDKLNIENYLSGIYKESSLTGTRYYKYTGPSQLQVEIGLKKDYSDFNLMYDSKINEIFSCELKLLNNDDTNCFDISSDDETLTNVYEILNYATNYDFKSFSNQLGIDITEEAEFNQSISLYKGTFNNYNFLNKNNTNYININYNFVVGYKFKISNIVSIQVPATTVCALCHLQIPGDETSYNYSDFGIYEVDNKFLSENVFYNTGSLDKCIFGLGKLTSTEEPNRDNYEEGANTINNQLISIKEIDWTSEYHPGNKSINARNQAKELYGLLGKLTFCLPHAHAIGSTYGVNIHNSGYTDTTLYGIPPEPTNKYGYGKWDRQGNENNSGSRRDYCWGTNPMLFYSDYPKYNMCLNTVNMIENYSDFISTVDYKIIEDGLVKCYDFHEYTGDGGDGGSTDNAGVLAYVNVDNMLEYTGISASNVEKFNKALIQTMKNVYAYNPDYDLIEINKGDIFISKHTPKFTSNLVSTNATLEYESKTSLNDFVYFGYIQVTLYLTQMYTHADIKSEEEVDSRVLFKANLKYCGLDNLYCLLTQLTYNTPVPLTLESELDWFGSNLTVIKNSKGTNTFVKGTPNKKALYYLNSCVNKMIELDVVNYNINQTTGDLQGFPLLDTRDKKWKIKIEGESYVFDEDYSRHDSLKELLNAINETKDNYFISIQKLNRYAQISTKYEFKISSVDIDLICFAGTSLTFNDLVYIPNKEGHRLYVKNDVLIDNPSGYRNHLYYRTAAEWSTEWRVRTDKQNDDKKVKLDNDKLYKNYIKLLIGPCFKLNSMLFL